MGIVRAAQKGTLPKEKTSPEVQRAASSMKKKDVKKFASTKHKGLPEKKVTKESFNEDYVKELEDGLVKLDYPTYDEVDELMKKIAKDNGIDTTVLHMAFKTKHLMVPDDWAKKKMFEPVMIPKTPKDMECEENLLEYDGNYHMNKIAKERGLDLTDPRQRRRANSLARKNAAKGNVNNPAGFSKRKKRTKIAEEGLRDWFGKSKSKDGKGGWVNVVTGGTCASDEPGEGTPKCVSSAKRASMSKSERLSAARRKKAADPGQQSKSGAAKPTYVSTDSPKKKVKKEEFQPLVSEDCWDGYEQDGMKTMFGKRYPNCVKKKKKKKKTRKEEFSPIQEGGLLRGLVIGAKIGKQYRRDEYGDPIKPDGSSALKKNVDKNPKDEKITRSESKSFTQFYKECWKTHERVPGTVKGAKGSCRPKTAKEPTRKEEFEIDEAKNAAQQAAIAISKRNRLQDLKVAKKRKLRKESLDEKLVHGKFGNYIKNQKVDKTKEKPMKKPPYEVLAASYEPIVEISMDKASDAFKKANRSYQYADSNEKRQKFYKQGKKFANYAAKKYKKLVSDRSNLDKTFNKPSAVRKEEVEQIDEFKKSPAWQRKAGKSESGGLNAKGVASYRRANPGSKLKTAVTTKPSKLKKGSKSAKRRLSFCRRMKGMKKKLTSAKTARDPNSRINKSLRKWHCSYEPEGNFISESIINELETRTMLNYIDKASDSASKQLGKAKKAESKGKHKKATKARLKMDKRESGIEMAKDKIIKRQGTNQRDSIKRSFEGPDAVRNEAFVKGGIRSNPSTTSTKKVSGMITSLKRKQSVLRQPMKAMDAGARGRRLLQRREHEKYVSPIIPDHLKDEFTPVIETKEIPKNVKKIAKELDAAVKMHSSQAKRLRKAGISEGKKKCGEGEYYCNDMKKCRPIPKGYRVGYGGMLRPEKENDESNGKKGGSNGNGNGHGGNGNGHGGNGNGGNGGGGNSGGE